MKLIVVALEEEFPKNLKPDGYNIIYTGIGKINATHALARYLTVNPHTECVINYGSAGASDSSVAGELLGVYSVMERDMDLTPIGYPQYMSVPKGNVLIFTSNRDTEIICGTGDSFARPTPPYHIVDMEAYALAKVCRNFEIPFYCYKYISDIDDDADPAEAWKENVSKGAKKFKNVLT